MSFLSNCIIFVGKPLGPSDLSELKLEIMSAISKQSVGEMKNDFSKTSPSNNQNREKKIQF